MNHENNKNSFFKINNMKNTIYLLIGLITCFSISCFAQERQNETRAKLDIVMLGQSERLSKITGWSKLENAEGKYWKQSDANLSKNYLPGNPDESFEYFQMFKFRLEGEIFYMLNIKYNAERMRQFAFTSSSFARLKNIVETADGKSRYAVDIKDCEYTTKRSVYDPFHFDPEEAIKNKEMIRLLLTGEGSYLTSNNCKKDSLFLINSQVLKGELIVRFNLIPWNNSDFTDNNTIWPLDNNYFEIEAFTFDKLFEFSPYINYQEQKKIDDKAIQQSEDLKKAERQEYYDEINTKSYFTYPVGYVNELGDFIYPKLQTNAKDYSDFIDTSFNFESGKSFNIVVGTNGKVFITPPNITKLFEQLVFDPAKVLEFKKTNIARLPGDPKPNDSYAVNCEIPVVFNERSFDYGKKDVTYEGIIIKLKKSSNGVEILNIYTTSDSLARKNMKKLVRKFGDANKSNGKYYLYFSRASYAWDIFLYPEEKDMGGYPRTKIGFFYKKEDTIKIVDFDASEPDPRCP